MIIEYSYRYRGDNGSCYGSKLDDEQMAIACMGSTSFHLAIHGVTVDRVIGGEDGALERIRDGVAENVAEREKVKQITLLKDQIRQLERFFASIDKDILTKTKSLHDKKIELNNLESE